MNVQTRSRIDWADREKEKCEKNCAEMRKIMNKKKMGIPMAALICMTTALLFGCASQPIQKPPKEQEVKGGSSVKTGSPVTKSAFLLNTFVTVTLYDSQDESILDGCMELCKSYENLFSKTITTSEIYQLNHRDKSQKTASVSEETAALIEKGLYYSSISDGDFDITIEPLSTLWNFTDGKHVIPSDVEIQKARETVGYDKLKLSGTTLQFEDGDTTIDLGAIAKGYIADRMKDYLKEQGVESAIINLGGNVLCVGEKPGGQPFKIGLQKPFEDRNETIETLDIRDMSVVSSGVYERNFIVDGVNYHHILNPKTGYPYDNGLIAVTIISKDSVDGDGLSTACFSMGLLKGIELLDSMDDVYGVFITEDYEIHYSQGARQLLAE